MESMVELECELIHETDAAWKLDFHGTGDGEWVPKSICEFDGEIATMPEDYAIKRGWV